MKRTDNPGRLGRRWNLAAASVLLCGLAAQGGSANADEAFDAKAKQIFETAVAEQTAAPPSAGPKIIPGKSIVIIPCAMAAEGCARQARGVQEAATLVGWNATLIDPAGDPAKMADAVQKAISMKVDGIILNSIDAAVVQGALQQARDAGIKIVAMAMNQNNMFDATLPSNDNDKYFFDEGYTVAAAAYVLGDNKLRMLQLRDDEFGSVKARADGSNQFIEDCKAAGGDCELLASENTLVTNITTLVPKQAVSLVQRYPDYTMLWTGYDAALSFVIQQGLVQAGLADKGFAVGFDANVANLTIIRDGGYERATLGLPLERIGFALVDQMNRLLSGQSATEDQGIRSRLLVKANIPATGAWEGDVDFRAAYKKNWGVE